MRRVARPRLTTSAMRQRPPLQKGDFEMQDGFSKRPANFTPLSPVELLARSAGLYPPHVAVQYGELERTYSQFHERCQRLGSALLRKGIARGYVVSALPPNTPAHLEA